MITQKVARAEAYYCVMINTPVACLTLNKLQSLMVGCETSIHSTTKKLRNVTSTKLNIL